MFSNQIDSNLTFLAKLIWFDFWESDITSKLCGKYWQLANIDEGLWQANTNRDNCNHRKYCPLTKDLHINQIPSSKGKSCSDHSWAKPPISWRNVQGRRERWWSSLNLIVTKPPSRPQPGMFTGFQHIHTQIYTHHISCTCIHVWI